MFFLTYNNDISITKSVEPRYYFPVSTGTAAHVNWYLAFYNALIETIQIHTFNNYWYFNEMGQEIIIDDINLKTHVKHLLSENNCQYHPKFILMRDNFTNLIVIGCYLISNDHKYPCISFGIKASYDIYESNSNTNFSYLHHFY